MASDLLDVDTRFFILKSFNDENVRRCMEEVSANIPSILFGTQMKKDNESQGSLP